MTINNCPWCGSKAVVGLADGGPGIGIDYWFVRCTNINCGAEGPHGTLTDFGATFGIDCVRGLSDEELDNIGSFDAISKWNRVPPKQELYHLDHIFEIAKAVTSFYIEQYPGICTHDVICLEKACDKLEDLRSSN